MGHDGRSTTSTSLPGWARMVSRIVGPLFLRYFLTKPIGATPRHIGTMPAIKARPKLELDFEAERTRFLERLAEVESLDGVIQHAMYGAMKADDAKALVRHHTSQARCSLLRIFKGCTPRPFTT